MQITFLSLMASNDGMLYTEVQEYYGKTLQSSNDLKTNACCTTSGKKRPRSVLEALSLVHDQVIIKYYGCGLVFPEAIDGCSVVDLGSGSGRDCFILSKLVGSTGTVTGVDMTTEQLQVAQSYIDYHTKKFGYESPNVRFLKGYIEELRQCGITDDSTDIIVSNCVINLCPDKRKALKEAYRILKIGGEMYFSDVYSDKAIPQNVRENKMLYGECIGGALIWTDLIAMACEVGFAVPILVDVSPIVIEKPELKDLTGDVQFCSATYRLFKISPDDSNPLNARINVQYKGTITDHSDEFCLSHDITISRCCPTVMSASVAQLLMDSRLGVHFSFTPVSSTSLSTGSSCRHLADFANINPFNVMDKKEPVNNNDSCSKKSSCC